MNITINVNVGKDDAEIESDEPKVKILNSKTKNGRKSVLRFPEDQTQDRPNELLKMMGL